MDFELLGKLGWREGLILVIVLLVTYIVIIFLRMRRLQRELGGSRVPASVVQSAVAAYTGIQGAEAGAAAAAVANAGEAAPEPVAAAVGEAPAGEADPAASLAGEAVDFAWNEPPAEIPGQALIDALQDEVYQLRCELDDMRADLLTAREDFRRQLAQFSESSPQAAAPIYNDAMQMAAQGQDAASIAQHCGIARAEADLVVALVRNRNDVGPTGRGARADGD